MNPKLIEAQIEAQALHEAYRGSIVEFQAQKVKADAQTEVMKAAQRHMNELKREANIANEKLATLHEQEANIRRIAQGGGLVSQ